MSLRVWASLCVAALALVGRPAQAQIRSPIEIRVVIVTTWEDEKDGKDGGGELYNWQKKWPLNVSLPFKVGVHPLMYDPATHVLAVVTGEATARAAASIMALGLDPDFDLSHAYWILAGTAGVDPKVASAGSVAWERWVVDGDLAQELDPRDMPSDWPIGIVPYGRTQPYEAPAPAAQSESANVAFALNRKLVDWAYAKTKSAPLKDDALERKLRAPYSGPGAKPPFVLEGEGLMSARNWYGPQLNQWAEKWVDYWTGGQGVFAMSAEEDTGVMQALSFLAHGGRVDLNRVLLLRGGSDYTIEPAGVTGAEFLAKETKEGFPATPEALDNLYAVGAPVAKALTADWAHTRDTIPGGP
ncbi:MAG TPA: purine nucleoside permease [Caulobacteraceae bacterium]|nr:purine nucleoside permease [Caulobacteraceae bacterium]